MAGALARTLAGAAWMERERPEVGDAPASFGQERMWLAGQLDPAAYNEVLLWDVRGPVDPACLHDSLLEIVDRHEVLRTALGMDDSGVLVQRVLPIPAEVLHVLSDLDGERARSLALASTDYPFDLEHEVPFRACLVSSSVDQHVLAIAIHHAAFDYESTGILLGELQRGYDLRSNGGIPQSPRSPLVHQYRDFALRQRGASRAAVWQDNVSYWRAALQALVPPVPKSAAATSASQEVGFDIGSSAHEHIRRVAQSLDIGVGWVLLAAYQHAIATWLSCDRVGVSVSVDERETEFADVIGFFSNVVVVEATRVPDPAHLDDIVLAGLPSIRGALAHAALPFHHALAAAGSRASAFPLSFSFRERDTAPDPLRLGAATLEPLRTVRPLKSRFGVSARFRIGSRTLGGTIVFRSSWATAGAVRSLVETLLEVLSLPCRSPVASLRTGGE